MEKKSQKRGSRCYSEDGRGLGEGKEDATLRSPFTVDRRSPTPYQSEMLESRL